MRFAGIGFGIVGFLYRDFVPVWNPVPVTIPTHELFFLVGTLISLLSGIGLLVPGLKALAARVLVTTLFLWLLIFRLPNLFHAPLFQACWSVFPLTVMLAAAWVLYVWFPSHDFLVSLMSE